ncbi:hypothetical protein AB0C34_16900 [Nocardia sp. NPDC049220]|uniref:hypothetical protein n=1 Tax=Nocardia sp. NPDC049220 TaxID=3155273 RepID=UPI0033FAB9B2
MPSTTPLPALPPTVWVVASLFAAFLAYTLADYYGLGWRVWYASDPAHRRNERLAARVRRTWPQLAVRLRLHGTRTAPLFGRNRRHRRFKTPRIRSTRATTTHVIVIIDIDGVPEVDEKKVARNCIKIANAWKVPRVTVEQCDAGRLKLTLQTTTIPVSATAAAPAYTHIASRHCGVDDFGNPVTLNFATTPGVALYGRIGTSEFVLHLTRTDPHPTAWIILDGKTPTPLTGNYGSLANNKVLTALTGDDIDEANTVLNKLVELRRHRAERISDTLGVTDFWQAGPTTEWPQIVVVIDYTTFLARTPGRTREIQHRNNLADANTTAVIDLLAHGRQYGIAVLITTTERLIPRLRENLSATFAFGGLGDQAAVAALGRGIQNHPAAHPAGYTLPEMATTTTPAGDYIRFRVSLPPTTHDQTSPLRKKPSRA